MNFRDEKRKKTEEIEQILKAYLPVQEGKQPGHHGGDGIQSDGRREKTPSDASLGDLPDVWRCRKDRQTVHGGNRDDPYLFARTR